MKPLRYLRLQGKNVRQNTHVSNWASKFSIDKLIGYKELPCVGKADINAQTHNASAHDLFSLFTADIIKSNAFFVR